MAKSTAVGLDLGARHVRAAVVEYDAADPRGSTPKVVKFAQVPLDPAAMSEGEVANTPLVSEAVHHLFKSNKLPTRGVVLGCGGTHVTVREMELPKAPLDQLRSSLRYLVQDQLSVRVEDCVLDFCPTRTTDQHVHGLLVAALNESVERLARAVADAGVSPTRVDLAGFALARALARGPYGEGVIGIVNMGASATDVLVVSDGVPQMMRTLPYGGELVTESLMRANSVSRDEAERAKIEVGMTAPAPGGEGASAQISRRVGALTEAVGQTFSYHVQRTGEQVQGVLVTGRAALMKGLDRYLANALRLPMARAAIDQLAALDPSVGAQIDDGVRSDLVVATGLALGGAS
jgi:type IV pilus assembly protein PilM